MATRESEAVLSFWLDDVGPKGWYARDDAVDRAIAERFGALTRSAAEGALDGWRADARGALALLILLDQFPRNLHRGQAAAFAADPKARDIARDAVARNLDLEIAEPARQFFYLPFEHSEDRADQDWSLALFKARMATLSKETLWHVEQHRAVIHRFGRFPYRNAALGRESTPEEIAFLEGGGYRP